MRTIDINCDMGESYGPWKMGHDAEVMPFITSANVACGGHAGDPNVMAKTVSLAQQFGVSVGAHPGYPDLPGFGRRALALTPDELQNMLLSQLGSLSAIAHSQAVELNHIKPHGALYNLACVDIVTARAVVSAVKAFSTALPIYCLPGSELEEEAKKQGILAVPEGFVDRAYEPNGLLADRNTPDAVANDPEWAAKQALQLAMGSVQARNGVTIQLRVDTLCIHGDTPGAPLFAKTVSDALTKAGFALAAPRHG
ncbi:MAG: 5-oxoprolinase subunit PxpA [Chloroflexota bacterium]